MTMQMSSIVNSVGLVSDTIGVVLGWKYGLPESIHRGGVGYIQLEQDDPAEAAEAKRYDRNARWGMILLVFGFFPQLVSNFL